MTPDLTGELETADSLHQALYGGQVATFGPVRAVYAGPGLPVNAASGFGRHADAQVLAAVEDFYAGHGLPSRLSVYSHFTDHATLAAREYRLTQMLHLHARPVLPDDVPVTPPGEIRTRHATPDEFAHLTTLAFGPGSEAIMARTAARPHTQFHLVERHGRPVAAAALTVLGHVAWLFSAATLPGDRGRGAQTALLHARLHAAAERCATHAALLTVPGSASERNAHRAGFTLTAARLTLERPVQTTPQE